MNAIFTNISRTKTFQHENVLETKMRRCLTTLDLTLIGMASMIGSGFYILLGVIAKETTGPAVSLSFLMAACASGLSAWCYAEFAVRIPKAGSAYVYSYITVGELLAFTIGWSMILEHIIGAAAICRGLVGYFSILINFPIDTISHIIFGSHTNYDIVSPLIIMFLCVVISFGVKGFSNANSLLTYLNVFVISVFIILAFYKADISIWSHNGGFFPYGMGTIPKGAAQAYYAYVGYDTLVIASEEAATPSKSIPIALFLSVLIVSVLYCLSAVGLSLIVPYKLIDSTAALSSAMGYVGLQWAKYVISIGAVFAITCALMAMLFAMPRCIYALASDGLIFRVFSNVNSYTQTPVLATLCGGVAISVFAFLLNLTELAEMMSIGTLVAYIFVSLSVIIVRYLPIDPITGKSFSSCEDTNLIEKGNSLQNIQKVFLWTFLLLCILTSTYINFVFSIDHTLSVIVVVLLLAAMFIPLLYLYNTSQQNDAGLICKVPLVPFFPGLSIFLNIYLITTLNPLSFIRFLGWMVMGFIIYIFYGYSNSSLNLKNSAEKCKEMSQ